MSDRLQETVRAASDLEGLRGLLAHLDYDVSELAAQTPASLGVAERAHALIRSVNRIAAHRVAPGGPNALEVYAFEVTGLTADLRKTIAGAFRDKPANTLLVLTTRDYAPLDFVLVEKSAQPTALGARVAVSHRLLSIDRRNPASVHLRVLERMRNRAPDPYAQFARIRDAFKFAEWSVDEFNNRNLFSDYFLKHRLTLKELFPVWHEDVRPAHAAIHRVWTNTSEPSGLSPGDHESAFIVPLVKALGFDVTKAPKDAEADYMLRPKGAAADSTPCAGLLVYPWDRALDRKDDQPRPREDHVPGMRVVRALEKHQLPWAILTNGRDWRLYCAKADSRASNYYEVDLPAALDRDDLTAFRYFYFFFRAEAFAPIARPAVGEDEPTCFLDQLRRGSLAFAKELGKRLRKHVFDRVFPYLAQGFVDFRRTKFDEKTAAGDEFLDQVYDATLTLLYRLLFLLYAESLDLLPVHEPAYAAISVTRLKEEIATAAGPDADSVEEKLKKRFTQSDTVLYKRLAKLFEVIDGRDNALSRQYNVPAYNGGLFNTAPDRSDPTREAAAARFLKKHRVPDFFLARAVDLLARDEDAKRHGELVFIDYKALGVRQLGTIYEGLLMYQVVIPRDDWEKEHRRPGLKVALVPSNKARKNTGSYFTPQHIVKYIVANTVGPLLAEKFEQLTLKLRQAQREYAETREFEHKRAEKTRKPPRTDEAIAQSIMIKHEAAVWDLLDLKVLDPAMGSGHFLVETVDFISDKVLDFLAGFPWNPVQVLIDHRIRRQILESLDAQGVKINEDRLTDVNLIKRLVMKRCVYGVDLNPMAVELAKVSLWLDSFTLGAPLSFLDHHLKCGNSLIGSTIAELKKAVAESGSLFAIPMEPLERATRNMEQIADLTDATLSEVTKSADTYAKVLADVKGYRALLDCMTAQHFGQPKARDIAIHAEAQRLELDDWDRSLAKVHDATRRIIRDSVRVGEERQFFHWDIDFPDVFFTARREPERRAFDAVVGNPPYDELSEFEAESELPEKDYLEGTSLYHVASGGRQNLFRYFVVRAITIVRTSGRQSFIVPMSLLTDDFTRTLRGWLCKEHYPELIEAFPQKDDKTRRVFLEAKLSTALYVAVVNRTSGVCCVRTHPWDRIDNASPQYCLSYGSTVLRSVDMSIPIGIDAVEAGLLERIVAAQGHLRFGDVARIYPGELMLNSSFKYLADAIEPSEATPEILRGAHVMRWSLATHARQGESQFLDRARYIREVRGEKVSHHAERRLVYQRYAAIDNYRRLIGSVCGPPTFCSHTTGYMIPVKYSIETCAALFNSAFCEWRFNLTSSNNNINSYELEAVPVPAFDDSALTMAEHRHGDVVEGSVMRHLVRVPVGASTWSADIHNDLAALACEQASLGRKFEVKNHELLSLLSRLTESGDVLLGIQQAREVDYLGWDSRFSTWRPDDHTAADGRWFPNGVAPPMDGNGPGDIPWDLIARVYPSYPLPGIDAAAWETAAWEEFCELLRKNKSKIGNTRIRADLTGRGAVENPTGPMRKLREVFLKYHREIRENRAKAAEIDFLIDRIVFRLFDLTLDEQKLILSRVGPGRPLPRRKGRKKKPAGKGAGSEPTLFDES